MKNIKNPSYCRKCGVYGEHHSYMLNKNWEGLCNDCAFQEFWKDIGTICDEFTKNRDICKETYMNASKQEREKHLQSILGHSRPTLGFSKKDKENSSTTLSFIKNRNSTN